jgi:protein subunit release factor B
MILDKTWQDLKKRLQSLGIEEKDLVESFTLSSKKGGQNVNKTSSCVHLKHTPSGIEVKCQLYRSQAENRYHARKILAEKFEEKVLGKESPKSKKLEKILKQKKKRLKRAKLKHEIQEDENFSE